MESVEQSMSDLINSLTEVANNPKHLQRIVKNAGGNLNKAECAQIMNDLISDFRQRVGKEFDELIKECNVAEKMSELKELTEKSAKENEELGLAIGIVPKVIQPALKDVRDAAVETLEDAIDELNEDNNKMRFEIDEKTKILQSMQDQLLTKMGRSA